MSRKANCWDNAVMERFFLNCRGQPETGRHPLA